MPQDSHFNRILVLVAAPIEAKAVLRAFNQPEDAAGRLWERHLLRSGVDLAVSGISKANAAGAAGRLVDPQNDDLVISLGIGGTLDEQAAGLLTSVAATESVIADEGVEIPGGFLTCEELGFPLGPIPYGACPANGEAFRRVRAIVGVAGPIATVSTCSGTNARAAVIARRTGALVEAMEGAAIGLVCVRLGVAFLELRIVSNTTGEREAQRWDLRGALDRLGEQSVEAADALIRREPDR